MNTSKRCFIYVICKGKNMIGLWKALRILYFFSKCFVTFVILISDALQSQSYMWNAWKRCLIEYIWREHQFDDVIYVWDISTKKNLLHAIKNFLVFKNILLNIFIYSRTLNPISVKFPSPDLTKTYKVRL